MGRMSLWRSPTRAVGLAGSMPDLRRAPAGAWAAGQLPPGAKQPVEGWVQQLSPLHTQQRCRIRC